MPDVSLTASELLAAFQRRALSPVEHVRALFAHIERHEAKVRAFAAFDREGALLAATESERRHQSGDARALEGVPFVVKDLIPARGLPTRRGSRTSSDAIGELDAPAVARLREQGAILLGKTTTSEFGLRGVGESPLTGVTRNPWNLEHGPGGSSAGSVAAVAAGFAPVALGTDGGGSIRVPSAYAGVVGLKPSFGRVAGQLPWIASAPPQVGPIARSVEDVVRLLHTLSVPDARDPWSLGHAPFTGPRGLKGLRVAYSEDLGYGASLEREVAQAFLSVLAVFRELGATLTPTDPGFEPSGPVLSAFFAARAAEAVAPLTRAEREQLDPEVEKLAQVGEQLTARALWEAEAARLRFLERSARFHEQYDLLLTPTVNRGAPRIGGDEGGLARVSFAGPFSLTRQPALSVPCGLDRHGLPIGLQIVGRHFEESHVLGAALAYSRAAPFQARPALRS